MRGLGAAKQQGRGNMTKVKESESRLESTGAQWPRYGVYLYAKNNGKTAEEFVKWSYLPEQIDLKRRGKPIPHFWTL